MRLFENQVKSREVELLTYAQQSTGVSYEEEGREQSIVSMGRAVLEHDNRAVNRSILYLRL